MSCVLVPGIVSARVETQIHNHQILAVCARVIVCHSSTHLFSNLFLHVAVGSVLVLSTNCASLTPTRLSYLRIAASVMMHYYGTISHYTEEEDYPAAVMMNIGTTEHGLAHFTDRDEINQFKKEYLQVHPLLPQKTLRQISSVFN